MRLTEEREIIPATTLGGKETIVKYIHIENKTLAEKKLFELENIEQDLGIDLIKISQIRKAIINKEKCYIIGWNDKIWVYQLEEIDIVNNIVIGVYDGCRHSEELKDYGKTWALTREELEK